jgi:hypothetical protein
MSEPATTRVAYTVPELVPMLAMCRSKVFALIRTGELASFKNGNSRRVTARALEQFLIEQEAASSPRKAA